jgi:formylglycine-generating enzyme required for sulfatase activity
MDTPSEHHHLGEYLLKACVAEGLHTRTWLAEQQSVNRTVLIEELRPDHAAHGEAFLADIRAKAAVDHPMIGSVYEAVAEPGLSFYARELLPGATLKDRLDAAESIKPERLAHYLSRIAEANLYHESHGHATAGFEPAAVHIDDQGVVRLENLTLAGPRSPDQSRRDIAGLGASLPPLVADGVPGATRLHTLLSWMRQQQAAEALTWKSIQRYSEQIKQQLAETLPIDSPVTAAVVPAHKHALTLMAVAAAIILLATLVLVLKPNKTSPPPPPRVTLPEAVDIADGMYPAPDGTTEPLRAFRISAHEVTIGQYAEFLEKLDLHAKNGRGRLFDHDSQPAGKTSHTPEDWPALLDAARANGTWQGHPVTLDSPVIGVDWWDAAAYAELNHGRLPTQEEWFAALCAGASKPPALAPGNWQSVTLETADRTPSGMLGMAGSVAEWTRRQAINPANPLGARLWVIIGASFLKPTNGALAREWTDDRAQRRADLGFRVVFDPK